MLWLSVARMTTSENVIAHISQNVIAHIFTNRTHGAARVNTMSAPIGSRSGHALPLAPPTPRLCDPASAPASASAPDANVERSRQRCAFRNQHTVDELAQRPAKRGLSAAPSAPQTCATAAPSAPRAVTRDIRPLPHRAPTPAPTQPNPCAPPTPEPRPVAPNDPRRRKRSAPAVRRGPTR